MLWAENGIRLVLSGAPQLIRAARVSYETGDIAEAARLLAAARADSS